MILAPDTLPNDPELLKQMLLEAIDKRQSDQHTIQVLQEQVALLRQRLFGRKSEQSVDPQSPQLAMFNEAESLATEAPAEAEEEIVAPEPVKKRGKRKPLPAELPRVEVIHELPEHELTCDCGCRKQAIGEETSEQLEIIPMQIRVIRHLRKVYACKGCEAAPVTADKPAQLIEKSLASPSVLAMLLTTKYADGLPLHRFEKVLKRHGVEIPRQTLARWVIQSAEHLQPLVNLLRDRLLDSPVVHCDETRVQVLKEPDRDPGSQSWMWVQTGGPPGSSGHPVRLHIKPCPGGAPAPAGRVPWLSDDRRLRRLQRYCCARGHRTPGLLGACKAQVHRSAKNPAQGQDRPCRHGAEPDQQTLRHRA